MITISSGTLVAVIPTPPAWSISSSRPQSSRQTLLGTMIHQFAAKSISASAPKVSQVVDATQADIIAAIDAAGGTCYLCDGERLFLSTIDASVSGTQNPMKKSVDIEFRIVREVSWA